jgi:hypothetical protein
VRRVVDKPKPGPADPFGPNAEGAISIHQMYEAFLEAGFAQDQAFELTRTAMAIALRKTGTSDD